MAIGTWDDFTDKFGFQDGAGVEDTDFRARAVLVKKLNDHPVMQKAKITAVEYDRPGMHNPCMILLFKNPNRLTAKQLLKKFLVEADFIETELPEDDVDVNEMISEAYASVMPTNPQLSGRELATVLAALRAWQRIKDCNYTVKDFADYFHDHKPLSPKQIDRLCERINR
jgi:hypothetical protein